MKKYELTDDTIQLENEKTVHNGIRTLVDLTRSKKADLSKTDYCWVYDEASVYDNARVFGDANVFNNASVYDSARVFGDIEAFEGLFMI